MDYASSKMVHGKLSGNGRGTNAFDPSATYVTCSDTVKLAARLETHIKVTRRPFLMYCAAREAPTVDIEVETSGRGHPGQGGTRGLSPVAPARGS